MNKLNKTAIYTDEAKMNAYISPQEYRREYFQELVDSYNNLNTGEPLENTELKALVENPRDLIAKKLIKEKTLNIGDLKLNYEKMFDIIETPVGTHDLIDKIENDRNEREFLINQRNADYFEIKNNDTVIIKPEFIEQTRENCTVYLTTKNQHKAYDLLNKISNNIKELRKLATKQNHFEETFFETFFEISTYENELKINPYFIKSIL